MQRIIMRRVYMSFGLSIVSHPMFWHGMLLSVATALLAHWLHVASIINNLLSTSVGNTPHYVAHSFSLALANGEVLMVGTLVLATLIAGSGLFRMGHALHTLVLQRTRLN